MISIAHLHPIAVHFVLALGVLWMARELFRDREYDRGETTDVLLELFLVAAIVAVSTGWLALAWDKSRQFSGTAFVPGWIHEILALSLGVALWIRYRHEPFDPRSRRVFDGILLALLLAVSLTGESLVFRWGAGVLRASLLPA
jgi:hypothetical protein